MSPAGVAQSFLHVYANRTKPACIATAPGPLNQTRACVPAPPVCNVCDPAATTGCNVCKECCADYIPKAGAFCDLCVKQFCGPTDCVVGDWGASPGDVKPRVVGAGGGDGAIA